MLAVAHPTAVLQFPRMADLYDEQPDDEEEARLLGQALRALRERAKLSQAGAAEAFGVGTGEAWRVYEAGTAPTIHKPGVQFKLAAAVGAKLRDLIAERDRLAGRAPAPRQMQRQTIGGDQLRIRDRIQAGAWLRADDTSQVPPRTFPAARDGRYPFADQWLSEVFGDSMNLVGISDGDLVHCVSAVDIGYHPRTGDLVEVERLRAGGRERELTIKQIAVSAEGWLLLPRSSNPNWQEPLRLADDLAAGEEAEVRIRGLVVASIRRF